MKAAIIANGYPVDNELIKQECISSDYVISADGGAALLKAAGLKPDIMLGDFDSIDDKTFEYYREQGINIESFPPEKDCTDTEICVLRALDMKCDEVVIVSGTGSRLDHSLGNIELLYKLHAAGVKTRMLTNNSYIYICTDSLELEGKKGQTVSILNYIKEAEGINLEGFKYPLENAHFPFGKPLGISNVMLKDKCRISIRDGVLLVIKEIYYE